jgi:hypothetical protein
MGRIRIGAELSHEEIELIRLLAHAPERESEGSRGVSFHDLQRSLLVCICDLRMQGDQLFLVGRWNFAEKGLRKRSRSTLFSEESRCQAKSASGEEAGTKGIHLSLSNDFQKSTETTIHVHLVVAMKKSRSAL